MELLADLADRHAPPEIAIHLAALTAGEVWLERFDLPRDAIAIAPSRPRCSKVRGGRRRAIRGDQRGRGRAVLTSQVYTMSRISFEDEAARVADDMADRIEGPSLDRLDWLLAVAAKVADRAASEIRDVDLNSEVNIRRVGQALWNLFEIRNEIHKERPDLMPEFLKGKG
jgi:BMFP domain-containing protein YqiC